MSRRGSVRFSLLAAPGVCLALLSGCVPQQPVDPPAGPRPPATPGLKRFGSGEEMASFFRSQDAVQASARSEWANSLAAAESAAPAAGGAFGGGGADGSGRLSVLNVQEAGVDEADLVRTLGRLLLVTDGSKVHIVDTANGLSLVSTIRTNAAVRGLHLAGSWLAILLDIPGSSADGWGGPVPFPLLSTRDAWSGSSGFAVEVYFLGDPAAPQRTGGYRLDGYLQTSRVVDGVLHLVAQTWVGAVEGEGGLPGAVPGVAGVGADGSVGARLPAASAINTWHSPGLTGQSLTSIYSLGLANAAAGVESLNVAGSVDIVYASARALYLVQQFWGDLTGADIHKFDLSGGRVSYRASGRVDGQMVGQYALGEHDGVLRVATESVRVVEQPVSGRDNAQIMIWIPPERLGANVFCLREQAGGSSPTGVSLVVVGQVRGIAPGESIFASRFVGPRGFLVTFERVDPLFTLDLSDPTSPRVVGELKIPGFSSYVLPLGEQLLFGIGQYVDETRPFPAPEGLQTSLFDVGDFARPRQIGTQRYGNPMTQYASSEAEYNPLALAVLAENQPGSWLLALPVEAWSYNAGSAARWISILRASADGLVRVGDVAMPGLSWWDPAAYLRSVLGPETVYVIDGRRVRSVRLADLLQTGELLLP